MRHPCGGNRLEMLGETKLFRVRSECTQEGCYQEVCQNAPKAHFVHSPPPKKTAAHSNLKCAAFFLIFA